MKDETFTKYDVAKYYGINLTKLGFQLGFEVIYPLNF